jgi:protein transport protein SEC24
MQVHTFFQDRMRVGFMTYDHKINFYNIKGNLSQPQQLTVGDVDDMFVPLVDGLMCSVQEADSVIDSLLEQEPML